MVFEKNPVYEPREDSMLLKEIVEQYAAGDVLEIGAGSGILTFASMSMSAVKKILAVDLNPKSVKYIRESSKDCKDEEKKKLRVKKSDLFSDVDGQFDTIIFNPPYLPAEKDYKDMALDGGKRGHELTTRFLDDVNEYLTQPGIVLLLFSSLTGKRNIDEAIDNNCLSKELLAAKDMGMETLYVYKVEKSTLLRDLEMNGVHDVKRFDKGKRGHIFTGTYKGSKVAIKTKNPSSEASESINNEIKVLDFFRNLNFDFIPDVIFTGHNYFVYYFIEGTSLGDFISDSERKKIRKVIRDILMICRTLDKEGFNKEEMHRPHKHIFISDGLEIKMIDFERAKETDKPKNVTQFCQYLTSTQISSRLVEKGICKDVKELRRLSGEYKKEYSDDIAEKIKDLL
ncbi:MAG: HemK2/MTQ2 family protein methyltransferase [Candidatus Woesearchaeota archaeon]